ncbi:radical SAM protein [Candidatus Woesearchaeota archaeon]|jgi:GTP 3',8-cyclase|nr:radical SAM protein [Candidatus Woesearchaeota archaeon]MBT4368460.1 radical SAM protein [Candidatus Woesearchaeota archaeon]MBT4712949.1 radical SAM protein [Candidatus Woesearchaeota archaeon]MBT6639861.1 radical SAM protein [Candidatus Woesearchaeota archaeon]MBT7134033.1 radical SAM protein [Candidatus Woesearchaeota archaeon]
MAQREFRFVVTKRCNYDCVFCHGEGIKNVNADLLSSKDYGVLFKTGKKKFGFTDVTLTGGEPLVRSDIVEIAKEIKKQGGKIVITSNGFFLKDKLEIGKYIDRINISLHSLDKKVYEKLVCQKDSFDKVLDGLFLFRLAHPQVEIRLNATIINGVNTSEESLEEYFTLAKQLNASVKFVELFPKTAEGFYSISDFKKLLNKLKFKRVDAGNRTIDFLRGKLHVRLSRIFCAFAEEISHPCKFCRKYNDLFVTPQGEIKPCRSQLKMINILEEIKDRAELNLINKIRLALSYLGSSCPYKKKNEWTNKQSESECIY